MKPSLHIILLLAAGLAIALLAGAWRSARHDSQQLGAALATQNETIRQVTSREGQRDSQLAAALASIQTQKRSVRTPQQAAEHLPEALPPLPLPVSVDAPSLLIPSAYEEPPGASISVPEPDLVPLYDALQDCRANALQGDTLEKNLADEKTRNAALLHERDAAIAAARGGRLLVRLKRAAKWFGIGVAAGAAIAAVARH